MKETAFGTLDEKPKDLKSCVIDGVPYTVPNYVMEFLSRRTEGEKVEFSFTEGEAGRRLTKIMRANRTEKPAQVKEPAKVPPPQLHHVRVIKVNEIALKYFNLSKDPKIAGERVLVMTPAQFGTFTDAGIKDGDEIDILIDAQGFVSLPPKGSTPTKDAALRENLDRMNGPADGEIVDPPGGELIKAPPRENKENTTTPPEKATVAPQGKPTEETPNDKDRAYRWDLTIGGTINLGNYENLKVEISGPACDLEQMKAFIGETLDLFGKGNPATRELIEGYKRRVL